MTDGTRDSSRPSFVQRTLIVLALTIAAVGVVGLLYVMRSLLMLIFGAMLFAVVLSHLAGWFARILPWRVPRRYRVGAVVAVLVALASLAGLGFASSMQAQVAGIRQRIERTVAEVSDAARELPLVDMEQQRSQLEWLLPASGKTMSLAQSLFASTFGAIIDVLILIFLALYFAASPEPYLDGVRRLMPRSWRSPASELFAKSDAMLWRWMVGRILAMALVGVAFGIGLAFLGVPMAVEMGIFAGLASFVPNIGAVVAVIPALLLAIQQGTNTAIGVLVLYTAIQFVESYFVTPLVQQHQVHLPPALVILAQIVAGLVFGFWGLVFATPLVGIGMLWVNRLYVEPVIEGHSLPETDGARQAS